MKYPKSFIVLVLLILVVAVAGCLMFSSESQNPERLKIARTIAKTALKVVYTAYKSGGNKFAESKIDSMLTDKKLTEDQATVLKGMLKEGGGVIKDIVNDAGKKPPAVPIIKTDKNTPKDLSINMLQDRRDNKKLSIKACFTSQKEPIADANIKV